MKSKKILKKINYFQLLIITVLCFLSCKKEIDTNEKLKIKDSLQLETVDSKNLVDDENLSSEKDNQKKSSFTISCGSGCALTYYEESRSIDNSNYELKFKVTNYIDEKIVEESIKIYIFEFDTSAILKSIHLKESKENILLNEDLLIRSELIKIANTFELNKTNNSGINKISLVSESEPYKLLDVPFDMKSYIDNLPQTIDNSYNPSKELIDYLIKKGYEAENYSCNFLKISDEFNELLVSISRGDSQYFLVVKADKTKFLSCEEIGSIGEENKYFKIDKNYNIN
jgi:hypothetical protein